MDDEQKTLQPWQIYTALFVGFWFLSAYFDHFVITSILCLAGGICSEVLSKYMGGHVAPEKKVPEWEAPTKPLPPEPPQFDDILANEPLLSATTTLKNPSPSLLNDRNPSPLLDERNPSPLLNEPFEPRRQGDAGDLLLANEPTSNSELLGSKAKDFMPEEPAVGDLLGGSDDLLVDPPRVSPKQALNNLDDFDEKFASSFQRTVQQDSTEDPPALDAMNIALDTSPGDWPRREPHSLAGEALADDDASHRAEYGDEEDDDLEEEYANREVDLNESESEEEDFDLKTEESPTKDDLLDFEAVQKEDTTVGKDNPEIDIDLTDPAVNEAATRIQAAFKGFKVRRMRKK